MNRSALNRSTSLAVAALIGAALASAALTAAAQGKMPIRNTSGSTGIISDAEARRFLVGYATALSESDFDAITQAWHVPSIAVGPSGSVGITSAGQVTDFFRKMATSYESAGVDRIELASAEIRVDSAGVTTASVTWQTYDAEGRALESERGFYVLSRSGGRVGIDLFSHG